MGLRLVYLLLLSLGVSSGQQTPSPLIVRSIKVKAGVDEISAHHANQY
jgi:hypothetical protein